MTDWIQGWWHTFLIWAFDRETWQVLTSDRPWEIDDAVEVHRPEAD